MSRCRVIAEVQCLPDSAGEPEQSYRHIEAAIATIADSGLKYEVGALGTTLEGEADDVWRVIRAAHDAVLASGAGSLVSVVKVFGTADADSPSMRDLTGPHR